MKINYDYGKWQIGESKFGQKGEIEIGAIEALYLYKKDIIRVKKYREWRVEHMKDAIAIRKKAKRSFSIVHKKTLPISYSAKEQYKAMRKVLKQNQADWKELEARNEFEREWKKMQYGK